MNPSTMNIPFDLRLTAIQTMLKTRNIEYNKDEYQDLTQGIQAEQEDSIKSAFAFLNKHKDMLKGMEKMKF